MERPPVKLEFTQDEALILLEWISENAEELKMGRPERWAFWQLEAMLEKGVIDTFATHYDEKLDAARARLTDLNRLDLLDPEDQE